MPIVINKFTIKPMHSKKKKIVLSNAKVFFTVFKKKEEKCIEDYQYTY